MVSRQQIEECVDAARLRPIAVEAEDVAAWAAASGARLADNDNYELDADENLVAEVLVEFLCWCADHGIDPLYDDETAIPAMERLLGQSGLHPALMTEAMTMADMVCESLPEGFVAEELLWGESDISSLAIGF